MREVFAFFGFFLSLLGAVLGAVALVLGLAWIGVFALRWLGRRFARPESPVPDARRALQEAEEARDRAEAASEAKSRMLAAMSHEIRTPLNGILGMAELLVATGLDPEQKSYVEGMRTSGLALAALIEDILDFSKIEAGKFAVTRAPFDLISLVEGVVELLAPQAHNAGLEIAAAIAPDLPVRVSGDAARLRQVLLNLVGNAVKYTRTGGVGLRVSAAGEMVEFAIIDTGPGIAPAQREAIFEEFAVAPETGAPAAGSTGLGLSIARSLAEHMDGSLRLAETSDIGSRFVLCLPLPPVQGAQPLEAPASLSGRQALIVAASRFEAPYLAERLTAAGVGLLWASSREAGQIFLREAGRAGNPPDIVIIDSALGGEATRLLGEAGRAAGVGQNFVFFSPADRRAFGQDVLQAFDGWLIKPLRARSLYAHLAEDRVRTAQPAQAHAVAPNPALRGLNVLFAEDNDINALIILRHLEKGGARITHAADGIAALQAAKAAIDGERPAYDAILLDVRMPGLDGIEVTRRIRLAEQAAGTSPCRIIALSADAFAAAIEAARCAGADEFLTKPVDLAQLDRLLAAAADQPLSLASSASDTSKFA